MMIRWWWISRRNMQGHFTGINDFDFVKIDDDDDELLNLIFPF